MNYRVVRTVTLMIALLIVGLVAPASLADHSRLSDSERAKFASFLNGWPLVGAACQDGCPEYVKVALMADNRKYVAAEGGGGRELVANRNSVESWESFKVTFLPNNRLALKASNGQYVCAENGGGGAVVANRDSIGDWETFSMDPASGGRIALKTHDGHYLSAEGGGGRELVANRDRIGPWESFYIYIVP